jgi:hypothetical protein
VVGTPPYEYRDGAKVYLKFTEIGNGVDVYLRASSDIKNRTFVDVPLLENELPIVGVEYEIDQGNNFIITAVPKKD